MNNDRQTGMGIGLIPFTSIHAYAERYRVDDLDAFDRFLTLIKAMDSAYIDVRNAKPEQLLADEVDPDDDLFVKVILGVEDAGKLTPHPTDPADGTDD